jgi:hypothetical protein
MAKAKREGHGDTEKSLKDEVNQAVANPGDTGADPRVWVRHDGAVCFGDECVVVKPDNDGVLNLTVNPDACGEVAGQAILGHLIRTAGKGVRIVVPPSEVKQTGDKPK